MIEFLRRSDLDVKTKYFFIVMAYHSSRKNEGTGSTLETIIKRIGFSKSAARKAIKELHNARIIDLDSSLSEKMTSLCKLERFKSSFLDLPDFLINYIDSDSIRKKTINTDKNNNTSVVNKGNFSFQEFVCSFYIWIKTNKETCICLTPYKEIGEVVNGNIQKTRRILNNIIKYEFSEGLRFLISFSNGEKNKYGEFCSFCMINPALVYREHWCCSRPVMRGSTFKKFSSLRSIQKKFKSRIDFFELDKNKRKTVLDFTCILITMITSLRLNKDVDVCSECTSKNYILKTIIQSVAKNELLSVMKSKNINRNMYLFCFLSFVIYHKYLSNFVEKYNIDSKLFFYYEGNELHCYVVDGLYENYN